MKGFGTSGFEFSTIDIPIEQIRAIVMSFMTPKEREVIEELKTLEGLSFSKAADGYTTRKRILKKFKSLGIIKFERGQPILITRVGRLL